MADCNNCPKAAANEPVPYIVHEAAMARLERVVKRLWVLIIIALVALVASNVAWVIYESQYETVEVTQDNDEGYNNFIGNDGDINYGTTDD